MSSNSSILSLMPKWPAHLETWHSDDPWPQWNKKDRSLQTGSFLMNRCSWDYREWSRVVMCECAQWLWSFPTCSPMDYSLPGSCVHGIFQARVLEWVAIAFSRVPAICNQKLTFSNPMLSLSPFKFHWYFGCVLESKIKIISPKKESTVSLSPSVR